MGAVGVAGAAGGSDAAAAVAGAAPSKLAIEFQAQREGLTHSSGLRVGNWKGNYGTKD